MILRWAYEALAVYQFKNNKFQKHFFDLEQEMSEAAFISNFLVSQLENKIDNVLKYIDDKDKIKDREYDLEIVRNEMQIIGDKYSKGDFPLADKLNADDFDEKIANQARFYLSDVRKEFNKKYSKASRLKDDKFSELIKTLGDKSEVDKLKQDYHNQALSDFVLNKQELNKIHEIKGRLIQLMEPVYKMPEANNGRAHFYAPYKKIFGVTIDTYWFNIIVIWLTSLILYFTLLTNALKKALVFFESISFRSNKSKE